MNHEPVRAEEQVTGSSDRTFGLVFAGFFALLGLFPLVVGGSIAAWLLVPSLAFLLVSVLKPNLLAPLNRLWMRLGAVLHKVVNPLVLGIMFFLVVVPTGLLMRAFGKDPLRLKIDEKADSYWIKREPPGPAKESIKDQF